MNYPWALVLGILLGEDAAMQEMKYKKKSTTNNLGQQQGDVE